MLLTEDKKAFKKSISKNKNKVRFCFDDNTMEIPAKDGEEENKEDEDQSSPLLTAKDFHSNLEGTIDLDANDVENDGESTATEDMDQESDLTSDINQEVLPEKNIPSDKQLPAISNQINPETEVLNPTPKSPSLPILKVYLENNLGYKSFKYDQNTCVRDVLICLKEKLKLDLIDCYGLVIRMNNQSSLSSFVLLEETRQLYKIRDQYGSDNSFQCMFRYVFIPSTFDELLSDNESSFNYLYEQVNKIVLR